VTGVSDERAELIIDKLAVGQEVFAIEYDLAREPGVVVTAAYDTDYVVRLLVFMAFLSRNQFRVILEVRGFIVFVDRAQQQRVIDDLRTKVLKRLLRIRSYHIIAADHKAVLRRDPDFEFLAIAHHVESPITYDREQSNHAQHGWFAGQHIASN